MQKFVLITHTVIALSIIALVLLQRGKGADAGAAFGAGASGTVFGSRGASSFFSRATAVLATAFFASSLTLAYLSSQRSTSPESLLEDATVVETDTGEAPASVDEAPDSDMPSLDPVEDTGDWPALEEEPASDDESQ
ncbi:MAG: preprotein translocase subunit SecG [Proteobacteria bacterium]|nr:preprotein translocase subunit SecG [Pseudomonadota bacterium]